MPPKCIMIIAGEASGDMHGAKLAQAIKNHASDSFLFGIGGNAMQMEGVRLIVNARTLSVVGITEVFAKLLTIYRALATVKKALCSLKPDLLILIDFPDFNFHVAAFAKKLRIPILYYISPQIWAWRQNRVKKIKRLVDHMAVILPFEARFYHEHNVPVTFVGHPLLDRILPKLRPRASTTQSKEPVIGLLPGSREKEVSTLLPVMLEAAKLIKRRLPAARFVVSCSESIQDDLVMDIVSQNASTLEIEIIKGPVSEVFGRSRMLVAASGTVTLEAALYGIPMVIVYKVSPLSYWLGKRLIKVKHIGIVNLIVQKELLPELIQDNASPQTIADTVIAMISDQERLRQIEQELSSVRDLLGGAGASDRVARIALDLI
ncbi:MAG: lipid-A-disaccharide synthase [Deltaproteobacteria bacterium]|nr:lipid-A-disaccharide synthase [Deltaproteobacteria bacterium]